MKYEKPKVQTISNLVTTLCDTGSNASGNWGNCSNGPTFNKICNPTGGAPIGSCTTGTEAGIVGGCNSGITAQNSCATGTGIF